MILGRKAKAFEETMNGERGMMNLDSSFIVHIHRFRRMSGCRSEVDNSSPPGFQLRFISVPARSKLASPAGISVDYQQ